MFQFLISDVELSEKESVPVCPATPSNKAAICTPQVSGVMKDFCETTLVGFN